VAAFYGWALAGGGWERLCGPIEGLKAATAALAEAARLRGLIARGNTALTRTPEPPGVAQDGQGDGEAG
jgi:hypothetical protein